MRLKSISYNVKNATLTVAWHSGELEEDYNSFRSSEAAVPEFYTIMMQIGRKIWNHYLNLSENGIKFELKEKQRNVAVVRMAWRHPTEIKDVKYFVKMSLVYMQSKLYYIPISLPKIAVLAYRDEKMKDSQLHEMYFADPELESLLQKMEERGLAYAMGERAQGVIPGMEKAETDKNKEAAK